MAIGRIPEPGTGIPESIIAAKGDLIVGTANDAPGILSVGTNGQVLTADSGEATGLKFATPASGGMTLINTGGTTLSGASVTISSIPGTFNELAVMITGVRPATNAAAVQMRFNSDTASRYASKNGFTSTNNVTFTATSILICDDTANSVDTGFIYVSIPLYANTTTHKSTFGYAVTSNKDTPANVDFDYYGGAYNQTTAINALTFFPASGNWTSGTVFVYGVK